MRKQGRAAAALKTFDFQVLPQIIADPYECRARRFVGAELMMK